MTQHTLLQVKENQPLYAFLLVVGTAIVVAIAVAASRTLGVEVLDNSVDVGQMLFVCLIVYLLLSLNVVAADEVAGTFCYGRALVKNNSGLQFVPFGVMQIKRGPRPVQEFQCPGEPEQVQKTPDDVPLEPKKVRPIRVVTGGPNASSSDEILNVRMTLTLSFFVQWVIVDILNYASNFGSSEQIEKQVRDIGEARLAEIAAAHSAASFIDKQSETNRDLLKSVSTRLKNSGVNIVSIRLISPDVTRDVSVALANIPKARAEAKQAKIRAEGEKVAITKVGAGKAAAELAFLNARGEGQKKIATDLNISGESVLAAEAVRGLADKTDVLVVGAEGGMKDVMGLVKGAQSALKPKGPTE